MFNFFKMFFLGIVFLFLFAGIWVLFSIKTYGNYILAAFLVGELIMFINLDKMSEWANNNKFLKKIRGEKEKNHAEKNQS